MLKTLALVLLSFSLNSFAADSCTLNFKDFHSLLEKKSAQYKFIRAEKKNDSKKIITQVARLKRGEEVTFTGGGCAHLSYSFSYSRLKQTKMIEISQYLQYAIELLEETPIVSTQKDSLLEGLKKKAGEKVNRNESGIYELACGEAQCALDISKAKSLKISYIFML